jgi:hypothetical protein
MSAQIPNQQKFKSGDRLESRLFNAPNMNRPIGASEALVAHMQNNVGMPNFDPSSIREVWVGAIVSPPTTPGGAAAGALIDENYYVRRQEISAYVDTTLVGYGDDHPREPLLANETIPGQQQTVVAANLEEYTSGTHSLPEDGTKYVIVFGFDASDGTGRRLYVFSSASGDVLLKVTGSLTIGGGTALAGAMYSARIWGPLSGGTLSLATMTASTLSPTNLGTDPGADNAYVVNEAELGQTTHDLLATSNTATLINGLFRGTSEDGYPVFTGVLMFAGCDEGA